MTELTAGPGIVSDVLIALATGIVASATYEWFVSLRVARALRLQFGCLEGRYSENVRQPGSKVAETGGVITLKYCGETKLTVDATNSRGKREWQGELFMRSDAGVLGAGFYSYLGKDDTGIHRVIYNPGLKQFDVSGENTSHPEGVKDFKMIWKRLE